MPRELIDRIELVTDHACGWNENGTNRKPPMCNLYRMTKAQAEIARFFNAGAASGANFADEVYPGYNGAVIVDGQLRSMVWGFPLSQKSKRTGEPLKPRPVNNARSDKLDSFMWRDSFRHRRGLIPLTAWAEAEGARGAMTRTWLSLPDVEAFAVAAIWRTSDEWGDCYSMVMVDAAGDAASVHDRMPVVLTPDQYDVWERGSPEEAHSICLPWKGPLQIDRTDQPWVRR
ncbi:SOS response-associated peptidase family protein [Citromicrobium bathyomarinum]